MQNLKQMKLKPDFGAGPIMPLDLFYISQGPHSTDRHR